MKAIKTIVCITESQFSAIAWGTDRFHVLFTLLLYSNIQIDDHAL